MTRPRILNAEPDGYCDRAREILQSVADLDEVPIPAGKLAAAIGGYDVVIVRLAHAVDRDVLRAGRRLRAVVSATTGLDHIDLAAAREHGVEVLSLRGEFDFLAGIHATAEHTWAVLLALLRIIPAAVNDVLQYGWNRDDFRAHELHGRTLGLVGLGRIGTKVARYGEAFGMEVLAFDPHRPDWIEGVGRAGSLQSLLGASDVVSLHVPLLAETQGMFGPAEFAAMRSGAILVNTSRGDIVDEAALLAALESGRLGGAALDVISGERGITATERHPLVEYARGHRRLLITPHLGGNTFESFEKTEVFMAQKVRDLLAKSGARSGGNPT